MIASKRYGYGLDLNEKLLDQRPRIAMELHGKCELCLGDSWGAHGDHSRQADAVKQSLGIRFTADDCNDRRRIQNQTGSPNSPYPRADSSSSLDHGCRALAGIVGHT